MCTRIITPFPDGKTGFPFESAPKGQLAGMVMQSEMVGMLNMLSVLSDYTNEVFSSILKESAGISSRITAVGERCASLSLKVEAAEVSLSIQRFKNNKPIINALNNHIQETCRGFYRLSQGRVPCSRAA